MRGGGAACAHVRPLSCEMASVSDTVQHAGQPACVQFTPSFLKLLPGNSLCSSATTVPLPKANVASRNSSDAYTDGSGLSVLFQTMAQSREVVSSVVPDDNRLVESTATTKVRLPAPTNARAGVSGRSMGEPSRSQWLSDVFHNVKG